MIVSVAHIDHGTRTSGAKLRESLLSEEEVIFDFTDCLVVGSGWADEAIAKLLPIIGPLAVSFTNMNNAIRVILSRALDQRKGSDNPST